MGTFQPAPEESGVEWVRNPQMIQPLKQWRVEAEQKQTKRYFRLKGGVVRKEDSVPQMQ
jgi:hypothetical protein